MTKRLRDNFGRWQKYATLHITKHLQAVAEETGVNIRQVVADKLDDTYKKNVQASYTPSSEAGKDVLAYNKDKYNTHKKKLTYHHTGIFVNQAIKTVIEGNVVKVKIDEKVTYEDGTPATKVYEYLTEGTSATEANYAYTQDGKVSGGKNYGMKRHNFEEWTKVEMKGFLASLESRIKNKDPEIVKFKYTGKKKKRTHYRGEDLRQG
ncbi:MAG: hypothetical protein K2P14_05175 [Anaeroplasmataceae bacterium]|nr:hypothetical protein [Anaeroplasmataceae bacterium]